MQLPGKQGLLLPKAQDAQVQIPGTAKAHLCKSVVFDSKLWLRELAERLPEDSEAGHLLDLVKIQSVTRGKARQVALGEKPLFDSILHTLLSKITELQKTDPLCVRITKEITSSTDKPNTLEIGIGGLSTTSRVGYILDQNGLL